MPEPKTMTVHRAIGALGLIIALIAWIASEWTHAYFTSGYTIFAGIGVFLANYLIVDAIAPPANRSTAISTLAVLVSILLLVGYGLAAAGVYYRAFGSSAPYGVISAIFLLFPATLILCVILSRRFPAVNYIAGMILSIILAIGLYVDFTLSQMLAEIPELFDDHVRIPSRQHFYFALMFFLVFAVPLTILYGLVRILLRSNV